MSEINRKLVSVRRITSLEPIENADRIEIASVDGWRVIVQKGLHKVNDLVLYVEIDAFLPVDPRFEFLRKNCFKSTKNLGDGFRIKTMKMKGVVSQGLILPLSEFVNDIDSIKNEDGQSLLDFIHEGLDLTEILGVQKYEKPIPSNLAGVARGNFPPFIPKTDQERWQNLPKRTLEQYKDIEFECSIKFDGSSMTTYYKDGYFGVCSRNLDLTDDAPNNFVKFDQPKSENLYWKVARDRKLNEALKFYFDQTGIELALQGELVGPDVQDNPQKFKDHDVYIFDIYNITEGRYLTPKERLEVLTTLAFNGFKISHVPVPLGKMNFVFGEDIFDKAFISKMADEARFNGLPVEGLVFKAADGKFSFKYISEKYLLKEKE